MEWISAIQKAINYIEKHLMDEINYKDVAKYIHTSSYEFHRTFTFLTGMTVSFYIRNRRLSLAGMEIVETDSKISDIALKYGYDTPESFTKAFTRFHGVAPKFARENSAKLTLFNPLVVKLYIEGGKSMDYRIVQINKQKFISIIKSFKNEIVNDEENHEIPDFWQECQDNKIIDVLFNLRPNGKRDLYGLCTPSVEGSETFDYGIGVLLDEDTLPVDIDTMLKKGYSIWDVDAGIYVVFDCYGEDANCIGETWSKFYKEFLPQTGYMATDSTDFEIYLEDGQDGLFCQLWIPIKKM